ncbi:MAG: nucleoside triphosphate pyrophosphatase [Myxococcota bacterium]
MADLYLASTSPHRRRLLAEVGLHVQIESPGVDERSVEIADPTSLARALALAKARAVAVRHPQAWVIGADQVGYPVESPSEAFGKPSDPDEHVRMLLAMVGQRHALVTGIALIGPDFEHVEHDTTVMSVRADIDEDEIRAYVATGEGSGCAGGYAAEGRGAFLFADIDGDWSNVIGLPLRPLFGLLRARGWRFGGDRAR